MWAPNPHKGGNVSLPYEEEGFLTPSIQQMFCNPLPRRTIKFKMSTPAAPTQLLLASAPYFLSNTSLSTPKHDLIMYVYIIGLSLLNVSSSRAGFYVCSYRNLSTELMVTT